MESDKPPELVMAICTFQPRTRMMLIPNSTVGGIRRNFINSCRASIARHNANAAYQNVRLWNTGPSSSTSVDASCVPGGIVCVIHAHER